MNKEIFKGNWNQLKGKVKQQWGKLTDDDITQINGAYDELEGRLQKTYGLQKEAAAKEIKSFMELQGFKEKETTR